MVVVNGEHDGVPFHMPVGQDVAEDRASWLALEGLHAVMAEHTFLTRIREVLRANKDRTVSLTLRMDVHACAKDTTRNAVSTSRGTGTSAEQGQSGDGRRERDVRRAMERGGGSLVSEEGTATARDAIATHHFAYERHEYVSQTKRNRGLGRSTQWQQDDGDGEGADASKHYTRRVELLRNASQRCSRASEAREAQGAHYGQLQVVVADVADSGFGIHGTTFTRHLFEFVGSGVGGPLPLQKALLAPGQRRQDRGMLPLVMLTTTPRRSSDLRNKNRGARAAPSDRLEETGCDLRPTRIPRGAAVALLWTDSGPEESGKCSLVEILHELQHREAGLVLLLRAASGTDSGRSGGIGMGEMSDARLARPLRVFDSLPLPGDGTVTGCASSDDAEMNANITAEPVYVTHPHITIPVVRVPSLASALISSVYRSVVVEEDGKRERAAGSVAEAGISSQESATRKVHVTVVQDTLVAEHWGELKRLHMSDQSAIPKHSSARTRLKLSLEAMHGRVGPELEAAWMRWTNMSFSEASHTLAPRMSTAEGVQHLDRSAVLYEIWEQIEAQQTDAVAELARGSVGATQAVDEGPRSQGNAGGRRRERPQRRRIKRRGDEL